MWLPSVNWPAVLVSGVAIFLLGGLWYSPVLFANRWMTLLGKSREELQASGAGGAGSFVIVFFCGVLVSLVMAIVLNHFSTVTLSRGVMLGILCWLGFAAPTSFSTALFSGKRPQLWLIDSAYNLVSFIIAGAILAAWR